MQKLKKLCFFREKSAKKNIPVKKIITDKNIKILCRKKTHQDQKKVYSRIFRRYLY